MLKSVNEYQNAKFRNEIKVTRPFSKKVLKSNYSRGTTVVN